MTDEGGGVTCASGTDHRFHHPRKPNACPECEAHVVVLRDGECLECTDGLVTPTDTLFENDWSPEKFPDEARDVETGMERDDSSETEGKSDQ